MSCSIPSRFPIVGAVDTAMGIGIGAGILLGLVSIVSGYWISRIALREGSQADSQFLTTAVLFGGFFVKLAGLAVVILFVPPSWVNPVAFVVAFMITFFVTLLMQARSLLQPAESKPRDPGELDSSSISSSTITSITDAGRAARALRGVHDQHRVPDQRGLADGTGRR